MPRAFGWRRYTVLALEPWQDRILSDNIGNIKVICTLRSNELIWSPQARSAPEAHLCGLLYFNLNFRQNGRARLMSAEINITLEDAYMQETVSVTSCAPENALKPEDAPTQERVDSRATRIEPQVQGDSVGVQLGSRENESTTTFPVKQEWSFHSFQSCQNGADFRWRRTSPEDDTGLDRSYDGALVLRRQMHKDIILNLIVNIQAQKYFGSGRGVPKRCHVSLQSGKRISQGDFDILTEGETLQDDIIERNYGRASRRKLKINQVPCLKRTLMRS